MAVYILNLLIDTNLQKLIVKILSEVYSAAHTTHDNPPEDMKHLTDIGLWDEAWWRAQTPRKISDIKEAFEEYIFAKMNEPLPITSEEFLEAFWAAAKPVQYSLTDEPQKYAESVYMVFVSIVANQMLSNDSFPLIIARVYEPCFGTFAECSEGIVHVPRKIPDGENWLMLDSEEDREAKCILVDGKIWDRGHVWIGEDFDGVETGLTLSECRMNIAKCFPWQN